MTIDDPVAFSTRNGHAHCMLCGAENPRSLKLNFGVWDGKTVQAEFMGDPELEGYDGLLHGGVIAALLDAAMTHCLFHQGIQGLTADLRVRYKHPVPCDAALEIRATLVFSKPPLYTLKAEMFQDGRRMAWAQAKFIRRGGVTGHPPHDPGGHDG